MLLYSVRPEKCKITDLKRNALILLHIVTLEAMKQYKFTEKPSPIFYKWGKVIIVISVKAGNYKAGNYKLQYKLG